MAELLFGDANPSGHLPISWEAKLAGNPSIDNYYPAAGTHDIVYREGIFVGYRGYEHLHRKPLYPFGYGLSYSQFAFSDLHASMNAPGFATVTFTVKNSGLVEGSTVAQVYIGEVNPSVERPEKELKGFQRVTLRPGESKTVTVNVNPRAFSLFDTKSGSWKAESGTCNVTVGDSSENDLLKTSLVLQSNVITPVSD